MLIILEGPDGAGKSSFAQALIDRFMSDNAIQQSSQLIHRGPLRPEVDPLDEYWRSLDYDQENVYHLTVIDRWHPSEAIYGPRFRGASRVDLVQRHFLDKWLEAKGALMLVLDQPPRILAERIKQRGDDFVKVNDLVPISNAYRKWVLGHPAWRLATKRPDLNMTLLRARLLQAPRIPAIPTYVGPSHPLTVFSSVVEPSPWTFTRQMTAASSGMIHKPELTQEVYARLGRPHIIEVGEEQ